MVEGPRKEVENERHEEGMREKEVPEVQGNKEVRRGEDGARGEMGEGRQVMLGPRHICSGEKEKERAREEKARETKRRRTFYASYVAHVHTHDARGAHTI